MLTYICKINVDFYFVTAPCSKDEFRCISTFHCIQSSLHCDQQPSCPDGTDERMPDCLSTAVIVGISVACVVLLVAVVIAIAVCYIVRKRRKRARIIKVRQLLQTFRLENKPRSGHLATVSCSGSTNSMSWLDKPAGYD